jgi:soluble lytic murein transglycosylase-like protein
VKLLFTSLPRLVGAFAVASGAALADTPDAPDAEAAQRTALRLEAAAYEHGEGVPRDPLRAATLYCAAARLGDAEAQFNLGWMHAHGRGLPRDDASAAYFFHAAAEQGIAQAQRLLAQVGAPTGIVPDCMRPPELPPTFEPAVAAEEPPVAINTTAPKALVELVKKIAPEYEVHPQLALSIIKAESNFDPQAVSPKNAQGLMQLIPATAARFRVKNAFDPKQNIRGGLAYLRWLLAYFEGDLTLVAAAYNAGEGTVERYQGVPPYGETRRYVKKVLDGYGRRAHPFDARITEPSPSLAAIRRPQAAR